MQTFWSDLREGFRALAGDPVLAFGVAAALLAGLGTAYVATRSPLCSQHPAAAHWQAAPAGTRAGQPGAAAPACPLQVEQRVREAEKLLRRLECEVMQAARQAVETARHLSALVPLSAESKPVRFHLAF